MPGHSANPGVRHHGRAGHDWGTTRWVLHVDLGQFIEAVEVLRHPELRS